MQQSVDQGNDTSNKSSDKGVGIINKGIGMASGGVGGLLKGGKKK